MLYADDVYEDDKEILTDDEKELHEVSRNGYLDMVKELLRNKINPNALDEKERSPLHLASGQGHVDVIKELLTAGAKIETGDIYGMNALLWAAWFGKVEVIKQLRQEGANMEAVNKQGLTVVHCAATRGNLEVLQYLVKEVFVEEGFDDEDTFLDSVGGKVSDILGGAGMLMGLGKKFSSSSTLFKEKLRPETSTFEKKEKKSVDSQEGESFSFDSTLRKISTAVLGSVATLMEDETPDPYWKMANQQRQKPNPTKKDVRPPESYLELRTLRQVFECFASSRFMWWVSALWF